MRRPARFAAIGVPATIYAVFLLGSWLLGATPVLPDDAPDAHRIGVRVPAFDRAGPARDDPGASGTFVHLIDAPGRPGAEDHGRPPIVLLHGSPGDASNFELVQPLLTSVGRRSIAITLPGYGRSDLRLPDASCVAHARTVLAVLERMGIGRAHVLGWSNGGGVAIHMAALSEGDDQQPRIASITLLGSIGAQATEGSGSYAFEHAKYALGLAALGPGVELLPHYGRLPAREARTGWLRHFWETDQRLMTETMRGVRTPTLILHGRSDFLVADWAAEHHHDLMPASRLIMYGGDHFTPFVDPAEITLHTLPFVRRHDAPGVDPRTDALVLEPRAPRHGLDALVERAGAHLRWWPWFVMAALVGVAARLRPDLATVGAGLLVARLDLDIGVAIVGVAAGRLTIPRHPLDDPAPIARAVRAVAWSGASIALAMGLWAAADRAQLSRGTAGLLLVAVALWLVLALLGRLATRSGRRRLRVVWVRCTNHEWWPGWALYAPVLPIWIGRVFKRGGVLAFTAANPGIGSGGGVVGERKRSLIDQLGHRAELLAMAALDAEPDLDERVRTAATLVASREDLGGYPVVVKPDRGYRGAAVRVAQDEDDLRRCLRALPDDAVLQRYHPGPIEVGVLWIRRPERVADEGQSDTLAGRIFALNTKALPEVEGDGASTLRDLIGDHPRYRVQGRVFASRLRDRLGEVPEAGEAVPLGQAGNHAQGARFGDGAHLITPELEAALDEIARSFVGGFDFGRFDIRAGSIDDLRRGRDLAVIEVNGTSSEATNIYDPERSALWAWGVLRAQWRALYAVADARIGLGASPMALGAFLRMLLVKGRPSDRSSD
ncbi:MAG: alpha/beta fold hydrolase [Planctomycetota bacterium]